VGYNDLITTPSSNVLAALHKSLPPPYLVYKNSRSIQEVPPKHRQKVTKTYGITSQKANNIHHTTTMTTTTTTTTTTTQFLWRTVTQGQHGGDSCHKTGKIDRWPA
jgi:hypothetical protein